MCILISIYQLLSYSCQDFHLQLCLLVVPSQARVKSSVSASAPVAVRKSTTGGASLKEEKNDDLVRESLQVTAFPTHIVVATFHVYA